MPSRVLAIFTGGRDYRRHYKVVEYADRGVGIYARGRRSGWYVVKVFRPSPFQVGGIPEWIWRHEVRRRFV